MVGHTHFFATLLMSFSCKLPCAYRRSERQRLAVYADIPILLGAAEEIQERDWKFSFEKYLRAKQGNIIRRVEHHKKRLLLPKMIAAGSPQGREHQVGYLSAGTYGPHWFIAVQTLSAFCLGRGYRRDGLVLNLEAFNRHLTLEKFQISDLNDRCLQLLFAGFIAEIWFDGRVSVTAPANLHDEVKASLERIADEYDIVAKA